MAILSKPLTITPTCYELGHCWTPYCRKASTDVATHVFKEALKIYGTLYFLAGILRRRGPSYYVKKVIPETLRSSVFLTINGTLFITMFCVWRTMLGCMFLLSTAFIPAYIAAFTAVICERKSRRGPLAVYLTNLAIETGYRMLVERNLISPVPNGEVYLFSVVSAVYLYLFSFNSSLSSLSLSNSFTSSLSSLPLSNSFNSSLSSLPLSNSFNSSLSSLSHSNSFNSSLSSLSLSNSFTSSLSSLPLSNSFNSSLSSLPLSNSFNSSLSSLSLSNSFTSSLSSLPLSNSFNSSLSSLPLSNSFTSSLSSLPLSNSFNSSLPAASNNHHASDAVDNSIPSSASVTARPSSPVVNKALTLLHKIRKIPLVGCLVEEVTSLVGDWVESAESLPKHKCCPHQHSCVSYVLKGAAKMFTVGFMAQASLNSLSVMSSVLKKPSVLKNTFFNKLNLKLAGFLGGYSAIFRAVNCILRWVRNKDSDKHGFIAGALAGLSLRFYRSTTIALYAATKLIEILYFKGIESYGFPYFKSADIFIYAFSTAFIFHAAVMEPHTLRPGYWKFLLRVTDNKFALMNRHLLDVFGVKSSKIQPDYWPQYDPAFTTLTRPKS
ncbi:unnamed protein product [Lymnaea stagnalis]|uniref:Transmembrane protein 135 N-terminal domain-containing protein n=1 Tax=Lymnaea stagnalis TaxID=6523 RepID=A0AAV2HKS4_LYMST